MKVEQYSNMCLEDGIYLMRLVECDPNQRSAKEDRMILLKWEEEDSKTSVWDRLVVAPSAAWKLAQLWVALGGSADDEVGDLPAFAVMLVQKVNSKVAVYARLYADEWQGKKRNKIGEYLTDETGKVLQGAQGRSPF